VAQTSHSFAHVLDVEVIGAHALRLTFDDGTVGDVRFTEDEWTGVLAPLRDPATFATVRVDRQLGTLVWPGGLDIAPEPLYQEAKLHLAMRASAT
jgi:hypothetical protein